MFRPNSTVPPTRAPHRRLSTSAAAPSVPSIPTRRSEPSSGSRAARRAASGTIAVRQPAAKTTTRRLAATSRGNQLLHPRAIDGLPHVAIALHRRADDEPIGDGQELGGRLRGDAAADQERNVGNGAPPALDFAERRRLAGGRARDD